MEKKIRQRPGRKRILFNARRVGINLTEDHVGIAERLGHGNISAGIRRALESARERH